MLSWRTLPIILSIATVLLALLPQPGSAAPSERMGKSVAQYGRDVEFYYQHPRPEVLAGMLRTMDKHHIFNAPDKRLTLAAFFGEIFRQSPEQKCILHAAAAQLSPNAKAMLETAISLAGAHGATIPPLLQWDILQDATRVAMCWAAFGASGDLRYIDILIGAAADFARRNAAGQEHTLRFRVGQEAARTLFDYARRHPRVMRRCIEARATADPASEEMLRRVVDG